MVDAKAGQLVLDLQVAIALVHVDFLFADRPLQARARRRGFFVFMVRSARYGGFLNEAAVRNWFRLWVALPPLRLSTTHQNCTSVSNPNSDTSTVLILKTSLLISGWKLMLATVQQPEMRAVN